MRLAGRFGVLAFECALWLPQYGQFQSSHPPHFPRRFSLRSRALSPATFHPFATFPNSFPFRGVWQRTRIISPRRIGTLRVSRSLPGLPELAPRNDNAGGDRRVLDISRLDRPAVPTLAPFRPLAYIQRRPCLVGFTAPGRPRKILWRPSHCASRRQAV